jgi:hypothetical protein
LDDVKSECVIPDFLIDTNSADCPNSNSYILSPRIGQLASLSTSSVCNNNTLDQRRTEFEPRTSTFAPINVRAAAAAAAQAMSSIPQSLASFSENQRVQFRQPMLGNPQACQGLQNSPFGVPAQVALIPPMTANAAPMQLNSSIFDSAAWPINTLADHQPQNSSLIDNLQATQQSLQQKSLADLNYALTNIGDFTPQAFQQIVNDSVSSLVKNHFLKEAVKAMKDEHVDINQRLAIAQKYSNI